jgi:hypothetical protein
MIYMPEHFDGNDWFILIGWIAAYGLILYLPREFPRSISCLVMLFSLSVAKGTDNTLGIKPFDLYDTNQLPKFDWTDLFTWLLYPAFGYFLIYFYQRLRIHGAAIPVYILIWASFATVFEALSVHFQVFEYKGWTLHYSFVVYLVVQTLTLIFFHLIKKEFVRSSSSHVKHKARP